MTRQKCIKWEYSEYGGPGGSVNCIRYGPEGTGLYADPDLYAAQQQVDAAAARNMARGIFSGMAGGNPMGTAMQAIDVKASVDSDIDSLLVMNACASPGLMRFQNNMKRFALGEQPLLLAEGETLASIRPNTSPGATIRPNTSSGATFKDSNYTRLLNDLIAENSQGWMLNRYVSGSVSDVTVSSRDSHGRPSRIVGGYLFDGFNGRSRGSVTVQFVDGVPQCLYFFDFPDTCRRPSRRIITDYENGGYQN